MEGDMLLKCNVCLHGFDSNVHKPLLLPKCGHSFCRLCLDTLYKQSKTSCPECRKQDALISVELLPTNFALLSLAETQREPVLSARPKDRKLNRSPNPDTEPNGGASCTLSTARQTVAPMSPVATTRNPTNLPHQRQPSQSQLLRKYRAQRSSSSRMEQTRNENSNHQAVGRNRQNQPEVFSDKIEAMRLQEELDFQMAVHLTFCKDSSHKHDDPNCLPNCWQFPAEEELSTAIHQAF
ncbi:uncharacterized protein LOC122261506 [Penaeus japonicus]|uniref:uncharacterized protein LOC122261506 n=1 Tax=Penaeus japonicus TaxID=27405 RepID=UPI001C712D57|nr:uncharacterized protein LOC122261506 [Penaeus japonicus]XP_042885113.1 uncharacterized protein LOC122261506 [Penaeus japonicus]